MAGNIAPEHSLDIALDLFSKEEYGECISSIKYYADEGTPDACSCLGIAYQLGLGLNVDIEKAFYYLRKAAEGGSGRAAHNLATLFATVPPCDVKLSKFWFNKARELGFDPSAEKDA